MQDLPSGLGPEAQLEQLGTMCAPGLSRLLLTSVQAAREQPGRLPLSLGRHACIRLALASQQPAVLQVSLSAPSSAQLANVTQPTPMLIGRDGPLCVGDPGEYRLEVRTVQGAMQVWVGAWSTQGEPPDASH